MHSTFIDPLEVDPDVVAVSGHKMQHTVCTLLLMQHTPDAADDQHGCLVQSAVGPVSAEQAARVISTAAQHCQQTRVWEVKLYTSKVIDSVASDLGKQRQHQHMSEWPRMCKRCCTSPKQSQR
jgi:hypothetical protein